MGCAPSIDLIEPGQGAEGGEQIDRFGPMLEQLAARPWLLSKPACMLSSTTGTLVHRACDKQQVQVVQELLSFLSTAPLATVKLALQPYCRHSGRPLPASPAEGVHLAVNMTNCKGQTPLMFAVSHAGSPELVKLLLIQGADPWVADYCGNRTALHYAAMSGNARCIEALMEHLRPQDTARQGVRYVNVRTQCSLTALHYAAYFDHCEALEELLRHDPQINALTSGEAYDVFASGHTLATPLHFAAARGNVAVARLLLQHYAAYSQCWGSSRTQDPRLSRNSVAQMPWQVATEHHPTQRELVALLHPGQPLERSLGLLPGPAAAAAGPQAAGAMDPAAAVALMRRGPMPLATIAAAALQRKFQGDLLEAMAQAPHAVLSQPDRSRGGCGAAGGGAGSQQTERPGCQQPAEAADGGQAADDSLCGVCFATRQQVTPEGCRHGLCGQCAWQMSGKVLAVARPRPVLCPFCRREVAGFRAMVAAGGQGAAAGGQLREAAGGGPAASGRAGLSAPS